MTQVSTGGYVRHRDRMVQESVFEDLQNTLIACRWMAGTTSRRVVDPYNPSGGWALVTTTTSQVLKLVGKREDGEVAEVVLIDYFPEAGGNNDEAGESRKTELNTLAIDDGVPQEAQFMELGSNMQEQPYVFTMAFYASSDAVAKALLNDLRDRYNGRLVSDDHLNIYNYNDPAFDEDTLPVVRAEIDFFRFEKNSTDQVTPWEVHLYFAELTLTDIVDPLEVADTVPAPGPDELAFRTLHVGDTIAYDADEDLRWGNVGACWTLDAGGDGVFVLVDDFGDVTYASLDEPDCYIVALLQVTSNDESVVPLSTIPVGAIVPSSHDSGVVEEANYLDDMANYIGAGIASVHIGNGVMFRVDSDPFVITAVG